MSDLDIVGPGQNYLWDGEYLYKSPNVKAPVSQTVLNGKKRVSIRIKRKESKACAVCQRMIELDEVYASSTDGKSYCIKHVDGYENKE